jgi:hypothetical protein
MADTAENYLNALVALSKDPELESLRDALLDKVSNDNLRVAFKRLLLVKAGHVASSEPTLESSSNPSKSAAQSLTSPSSRLRSGRKGHSHDTQSTLPQASSKVWR